MARYGPIIRRSGRSRFTSRKWRRKMWKGFKNYGTAVRTANSSLYLAKHLARMVNTEVKHFDFSISGGVSYSGGINNIFQPTAGTGNTSRVGSSCKPLHITLRGTINVNTSGNEQQLARVIIFRGKQENTVAPTASDILEITGTAFAPVSPKLWSDRFRTKILYDRMFVVNKTAGPTEKQFSFSKKLYGHTMFNGATTDVEHGGIYVLLISDVLNNAPVFSYYSRVSFSDS